ncbi:uncharacterized protein ARMOST_20928 [Armillaria ostoyae]|uniref:Uncharacterized protein n=1 Tax=Armillaria ostoyae TaxID=47428 RepID=A0A284S8R9_ARMOS|nr:uncharacterized protein ARMOST_20928 [Armillaria ostoyae]
MAPTTSGLASTPLTTPISAPTAPMPGRYDGSTSRIEVNSRDPKTESQWPTTSPSLEDPRYQYTGEMRPSRPIYSPIEIESNGPPQQEIAYETYDLEPRPSSRHWSTPFSPLPWQRQTILTWTAPHSERFNTFHYNYETFGGLDEVTPWTQRVDRNVPYFSQSQYAPTYDLPRYLLPLPDSPNQSHHASAPHPRRIQKYRLPQYGVYPMGGQEPPDTPVPENPDQGGSDQPPGPTREERLVAAKLCSIEKQQRAEDLRRQYEVALEESKGHDMIWNFNQIPDGDKGKAPNRGRPPIPEWTKPLHARHNRYSVPQPPEKWVALSPPPHPMGSFADDNLHLGVKPALLAPPKAFRGEHDDISCFLRDCQIYFKVFVTYFQLASQMIPFAASHLDGPAKKWDPAIEDVHEKYMFELQMGKNPATHYFQELETEADLTN